MYHYAANNPVKYTDPDGREDDDSKITKKQYDDSFFLNMTWDEAKEYFHDNPNGISNYPDQIPFRESTNTMDIGSIESDSMLMLDIFLFGKSISSFGKSFIKKCIEKNVAKQTTKTIAKSTGRTFANNLVEQLAMEQAKACPKNGKVLPVVINDIKNGWFAKDGWVKMAQNINGIEIHYLWNTSKNIFTDFKFK